MSKDIYEQSGALYSHLVKTRTLQFTAKMRATDALSSIESNLGQIEITAAATGEATVVLESDDLGKLQAVKSVEVLSVSVGTCTAAASIVSEDLQILLDSNQDLTTQAVDVELRVVYKLK